jgi:hypothetical protein
MAKQIGQVLSLMPNPAENYLTSEIIEKIYRGTNNEIKNQPFILSALLSAFFFLRRLLVPATTSAPKNAGC